MTCDWISNITALKGPHGHWSLPRCCSHRLSLSCVCACCHVFSRLLFSPRPFSSTSAPLSVFHRPTQNLFPLERACVPLTLLIRTISFSLPACPPLPNPNAQRLDRGFIFADQKAQTSFLKQTCHWLWVMLCSSRMWKCYSSLIF